MASSTKKIASRSSKTRVSSGPALEWTLDRAKKLWKPMTRAVQHVGVPGYQWQASVLWDGSLFFGPQLWRQNSAVSEEAVSLGDNLMDVSIGYGAPLRFLDRAGLGHREIRRTLDQGRLIIPRVVTKENGLVWSQTVFAHLLGRKTEAGMTPRREDALVVHALFKVRNASKKSTQGHLWLHFGNASQLRLGYKVGRGNKLSRTIPHRFEAPYGVLGKKIRYVIPQPEGILVWHDQVARPKGVGNPAKRVIEWKVQLSPNQVSEFRLIVPFGVIDRSTAEEIVRLNSDSLLKEARGFWRNIVDDSAGVITTADSFVNDYAAVAVAQTIGQIGYRYQAKVWMCKTTPAWYELYWPPCSACSLPALDLRGLTKYSRPVLQSMLDTQSDRVENLTKEHRPKKGKKTIRSEGFASVPGFLGNFGKWAMNTLLLSHGLELWALASHYRITRDRAWLGKGAGSRLEAIVAACDWLAIQRRRTMREENGKKVPQWGLLPAAAAHDWMSGYTIFNDAYCIYGMIEAVRLLREVDHPKAEELARELNEYRACTGDRYREARDRARPVPAPDGSEMPYVPREINELDWRRTDWTYTGYGPLRAGAWGTWDPHDELVDQALTFLEVGMPKGTGFYFRRSRFSGKDKFGHATADQNFDDIDDPKADRHFLWKHYVEYETAFPIGLDLFLQRDDLPRFFEWFFNNISIVIHHGFRVGVESLDGVPSETPGEALRWRAIRGMFVNERGGFDGSQQSLWLLQAIPRSWLKPGGHLAVKEMGTHFGGHVDLDVSFAHDRNSLEVSAAINLAVAPTEIRMRLRSDDGRPMVRALINGEDVTVLEGDTIRLPDRINGEYRVVGYFPNAR